ncbi:hypothetical protein LXA43DRAFT_1013059 [Ganoderma leucocontextum]|nr:hypothetical protein LXA43DRAFT_1013059 [Ganoderma leucocontextum]
MNSTPDILQSICGGCSASIRKPSLRTSSKSPSPGPERWPGGKNKNTVPGTIRYEVTLSVASSRTTRLSRLTASTAWAGVGGHARDMQLLSRHIGPYGVDVSLVGTILRTYISWDAVEWMPGAENAWSTG